MTIEEYARAIAETVRDWCGSVADGGEGVGPRIQGLDLGAIIASVPKPEGCPACKYYHGLPAPDVQAQDTRQDTRPPCNCPRDYAQYLGDDPHNRWCPRSRNPHPEVIQAQIDAARAEEREAICERMRELAVLYPQRSGRRHILCQLIDEIRARSGARGV